MTNGEYLKFVQAGGYENSKYWSPGDWEWKQPAAARSSTFLVAPSSSPVADPETQWEYQGMFGTIPLPPSWPVYVSHAEASAFTRWAGKEIAHGSAMASRRLRNAPRHRDAISLGQTSAGRQPRQFPSPEMGTDGSGRSPGGRQRVRRIRSARKRLGMDVHHFRPASRFQAFSVLQGYSADFFDAKHFVIKGGSHRDRRLHAAAILPQLVPATLSLHLHDVPLRGGIGHVDRFANGFCKSVQTNSFLNFAPMWSSA